MNDNLGETELCRRRLLWRAMHRGLRELDLIIGGFAQQRLPAMSERELEEFEAIVATPDSDLQALAPRERAGTPRAADRDHGGGAGLPTRARGAARRKMKPVDLAKALSKPLRTVIAGAPEGLDALILSELARAASPKPILHLARDDQRVAILADALAFFAPDIEVLEFPAWDCLPYDRVSPASRLVATRLATLSRLLADQPARPRLVISTVNAAVQRVPPRARIAAASFTARPGNRVPMEGFLGFLQESGFSRSGTVVDPGDFAVRGGIVDLYPPGAAQPVRLDFFGDTLESIRTFDPDSQRSTGQLHGADHRSRQ